MRRALLIARLPLFLTVVLGIALLAAPGRAELAVHGYVLMLAAIGLGHLLVALRNALPPRSPSPFDAALRRRPRPAQRIAELERLEREVTLGLATAFDLHYRLRAAPPADRDRAPGGPARGSTWTRARKLRAARSATTPGRSSAATSSCCAELFAAGLDIASLRLAVSALEASDGART